MKKILLIDDDEIILQTYEYLLTDLNYNVTVTNNSNIGLKLALNNNYDLIISDFKMTDISGLELLRKVKKVKKNSNIYISTGGIGNEDLKQVKIAGANGILNKPFNNSQISSLL